jgi:phenylalanyl-tRNA synthetase beta chain
MGGLESEVTEKTKNVLLEGAAWNFINIRKTLSAQRMTSEAAYRFSRGVHPAVAPLGVSRCLELMRQWSGGVVNEGLVDEYPLPPKPAVVEIGPEDSGRWLGIKLSVREMGDILKRLEFAVEQQGEKLVVTAPDHRLDIGEGVIGRADLMEEIARIYGYEQIPETRMADALPPQRGNRTLEVEERIRDILVKLGLQETISYRLTAAEQEARRLPPGTEADHQPYVALANPSSQERAVLRKSLLASVLDSMERNANIRENLALFEIGPVFRVSEDGPLPDELSRLVVAVRGLRTSQHWQDQDRGQVNFYDLKGLVEELFRELHVDGATYSPWNHPSFHPGKCARILADERQLGVLGELHPKVQAQYDLGKVPVQAATINLNALMVEVPERFDSVEVPVFPPILEDMAFIVDVSMPAGDVAALISQTGGSLLAAVRLFDVYTGEQVGKGKKSLAYQLTYQHPEQTLTDEEVAKLRQRIAKRLENELGAKLRSR